MNSELSTPSGELSECQIREKLGLMKESRTWRLFKKFVMAALGGLPWVGGFISAAASVREEDVGQFRVNDLLREWLEEHSRKMQALATTLDQIIQRLHAFGEEVEGRVQSEEYLSLVRKAFRAWDKADTDEKRNLIGLLIANAAAVKLCEDDLVRLFLDWIDRYHEAHFMVIRCIFKHPRVTRAEIWEEVHGSQPRENSADADLFKLLIFDLSTGHVIRQERPTNDAGQFLKKPRTGPRRGGSRVMKSAFDDVEPYVLTELGQQFVHYTMNEIVPRLTPSGEQQPESTQ